MSDLARFHAKTVKNRALEVSGSIWRCQRPLQACQARLGTLWASFLKRLELSEADFGRLFGVLGRHSGLRGLPERPGDRFWRRFGVDLGLFGVDFPTDFSTESAFEFAVDVVRDRLGGSLDLCAIGSLSATLRDSLHQPVSSIHNNINNNNYYYSSSSSSSSSYYY